jgi:hypothetical protein
MISRHNLSYNVGDHVLDTAFEDVGVIIHIDDGHDAPYFVLFKNKSNKDRYVMMYCDQELDIYIVPPSIDELN